VGNTVSDRLLHGCPFVRGLDNMQLAVMTARRGWATAADVLNTRGLDEVLGLRSAP
jgi:hypothetical protein